ncbi:anthranilate synthase component I family protein [Taibaiella chishuiensis]|uniref:Para-aminobenzoate synthetase component 1 n=1 Tax=Taibaiella chishuiensis TaxID=1434707 RepID=A0A2P8CWJ0_9BACT|nr:anthranilate synthase component I family protein [Taibaiella chishuiensis]PSK89341.1 para-aminobenzoate synthetase component 1 [Taibaiella chishuiensis]
MLNWLRPFSIFAYLDNNQYQHGPNRFELLVAAGAAGSNIPFGEAGGDWLFGHLEYDFKNQVEPRLTSRHQARQGFEEQFFFKPVHVAYIPYGTHTLVVESLDAAPEAILEAILGQEAVIEGPAPAGVSWQYRFTKEAYIDAVEQVRGHIVEGDCYELNLCTEAYATAATIDPWLTFHRLNRLNPAPFAAFYRTHDAFLVCASPERFLFKAGDELVSQPIKGTARRSSDPATDERLKTALYNDEKERAENVMIVDLVRNDLARSCRTGSVSVPELFGIYSFPQVHQLISTVSGLLKETVTPEQAIRHAFPMGSMTGAPKVMVMELIEQYERSRRGLYAGTLGYSSPGGDFDFNVVIRSLFYNSATGYLSYQTGGAITYDSVAAAEWEEVRLKARAMEQVFLQAG